MRDATTPDSQCRSHQNQTVQQYHRKTLFSSLCDFCVYYTHPTLQTQDEFWFLRGDLTWHLNCILFLFCPDLQNINVPWPRGHPHLELALNFMVASVIKIKPLDSNSCDLWRKSDLTVNCTVLLISARNEGIKKSFCLVIFVFREGKKWNPLCIIT